MTQPLLLVENLSVHFYTRDGVVKAANGVSFEVQRGSILGLVGESGSGKTVTGLSIVGMIEAPGRIVEGSISFAGRSLRTLHPKELRQLRGDRIAVIFQDPMMTLNPVLRIDTQMIEAIRAHRAVSRHAAREHARNMLALVGFPSPDQQLAAYPHQFSGGMRQRVAIAIAILNEPDLIIADEPTTALDVTIQGQILSRMQTLCRDRGTALIWITHDLAVVAGLADEIYVMYAGQIVERGTVDEVLDAPLHPYTRGLIDSVPSRAQAARLRQIPGMMPSLLHLPPGCSFRNRCNRSSTTCMTDPPLYQLDGRDVRCFHPLHLGDEVEDMI